MTTIRTTQVDRTSDVINFGIGQPDFDLLPGDILRRTAEIRFAEGDTELLNYGYEQGDGRFREALAAFLQSGYGTPVSAEHLMVTAGASQALDLICTLFTRPGDVVFVEEPSYFLALRIFADHRLRVVGLPTDEQGLVVEALEAELARQRPVFLYTIPTFQNPTGRTLPRERRERLAALSREHDFLLVADEVYHLLRYAETPPPPPLASYIETAPVLSIGSFSKILAPGLRLGWVQTAPERVQRFVRSGLVDSGGGLNHFTSNLVRVALEEGWEAEHLQRLRDIYSRRVQVMQAALREHLGERARFATPQGGYFFWLEFPPEMDTSTLLPVALQHNVGFLPGVRCSSGHGLRNCMRLCFAHYGMDRIERGIARLGTII